MPEFVWRQPWQVRPDRRLVEASSAKLVPIRKPPSGAVNTRSPGSLPSICSASTGAQNFGIGTSRAAWLFGAPTRILPPTSLSFDNPEASASYVDASHPDASPPPNADPCKTSGERGRGGRRWPTRAR